MTREERKAYIASLAVSTNAAIRQRRLEEKLELETCLIKTTHRHVTEDELTDFENIAGCIKTGIEKITGGIRHLPIIIL